MLIFYVFVSRFFSNSFNSSNLYDFLNELFETTKLNTLETFYLPATMTHYPKILELSHESYASTSTKGHLVCQINNFVSFSFCQIPVGFVLLQSQQVAPPWTTIILFLTGEINPALYIANQLKQFSLTHLLWILYQTFYKSSHLLSYLSAYNCSSMSTLWFQLYSISHPSLFFLF